jgi:hypothetical protein
LKIKELKKQVPNTKLKPLQLVASETASVGSRKDERHNMSVDSKIIISEKDQDSLISE